MDEKIKLMHDVIDIAMRINGGAVQRCGYGHPTAFFYYSGHVNIMVVNVHEDGWVRNSSYDREFTFRFDWDVESLKRNVEELRKYAFGVRFRRRGCNDNDT